MATEPELPVQTGNSTDRDDEREVRFPHANITAVRAIADVLKPTLGPLSRDVLVVETLATREETNEGVPPTDEYTVTSDGARIMEVLPVEHPVGDLVRHALGPHRQGETDVKGKGIFDGVTTKILFAGALLSEARKRLDEDVHPHDIVRGYQTSLELAHDDLQTRALAPSKRNDVSATDAARTVLTGNDIGGMRDELATIAATAASEIETLNDTTLDVTTIQKGKLSESRLVSGTVLDRNSIVHDEMPRRVTDASVLLFGGHDQGGLQDPDVVDSYTVETESADSVGAFEDHFASQREEFVDAIAEIGTDVVVTQQGINNQYQRLLADHGIMAIRGVNSRNLRHLSLATGATIVKDGNDVTYENLGRAGSVEERRIEQRRNRRKFRRMIVFDECATPDAVTILLRGVFGQLASQATLGVRKATKAAALATATGEYSGVVPGGGANEVAVARSIRAAARRNPTRTQLAMNSFADALESVVETLAHNAGLDPIETVANLRAAQEDNDRYGLVMPAGEIADTVEAGVVDCLQTKKDVYATATDLAMLVLRIDDAVDATFEKNPTDTGDAIYDDAAERHESYLDDTDSDTIWD